MLGFPGAALPSLHFHEKDPGSAQFLWSQLYKQIPESALIGALCESHPPQRFTGTAPPPPPFSLKPGYAALFDTRYGASTACSLDGIIGCLSDASRQLLWSIQASKCNLCFGVDCVMVLASTDSEPKKVK